MNVAYLRECFAYDEDQGRLIWCIRPKSHFKGGAGWHNFNDQFAGHLAGSPNKNGRIIVKLNGQSYRAARLIWALHVGHMDFPYIDHIDGNPANDRLFNLRPATPTQNAQNRSLVSGNSSGVCGVTWHKPSKKWWARITLNGKTRSLGLYADKTNAIQRVIEARIVLFKEFARVGTS